MRVRARLRSKLGPGVLVIEGTFQISPREPVGAHASGEPAVGNLVVVVTTGKVVDSLHTGEQCTRAPEAAGASHWVAVAPAIPAKAENRNQSEIRNPKSPGGGWAGRGGGEVRPSAFGFRSWFGSRASVFGFWPHRPGVCKQLRCARRNQGCVKLRSHPVGSPGFSRSPARQPAKAGTTQTGGSFQRRGQNRNLFQPCVRAAVSEMTSLF